MNSAPRFSVSTGIRRHYTLHPHPPTFSASGKITFRLQIPESGAIGLGERDDAHGRRADAPATVKVKEVESAIAPQALRVDSPFKTLRSRRVETRARSRREEYGCHARGNWLWVAASISDSRIVCGIKPRPVKAFTETFGDRPLKTLEKRAFSHFIWMRRCSRQPFTPPYESSARLSTSAVRAGR